MAYIYQVVFVETPVFYRRIQQLMDDDDYAELQLVLAARPDAGKVIKGSGGMRKLRWAGSGRGKRGGIKWCYEERAVRRIVGKREAGEGYREGRTQGREGGSSEREGRYSARARETRVVAIEVRGDFGD